MKVLVTGAGGFVGRALCEELLRRGIHVTAAVRAPNEFSSATETAAVGAIDGATDWTGPLHGVDVVIHLAARVHVVKDKAADPLAEFLKVNLHGTENLARQAVRAGVKRLVYASTVKVNGERTSDAGSFSESDPPDPHDPYGMSKWQAEQALQRVADETGLEVGVVRPPLVYGPGVKGNFHSLLDVLDKGVPLPLAGARNLRSLVYVGNLADALIVCATHPAAAGQIYLVSDGEDVSTAQLVARISAALGRKNRSYYAPPVLLRAAAMVLGRTEQVDRLFGSLRVNDEKIRRELGWVPPWSMARGLRATVDSYRMQRNGYNRGS